MFWLFKLCCDLTQRSEGRKCSQCPNSAPDSIQLCKTPRTAAWDRVWPVFRPDHQKSNPWAIRLLNVGSATSTSAWRTIASPGKQAKRQNLTQKTHGQQILDFGCEAWCLMKLWTPMVRSQRQPTPNRLDKNQIQRYMQDHPHNKSPLFPLQICHTSAPVSFKKCIRFFLASYMMISSSIRQP